MNAITFVGEIIGMVIYDDDHFFVTPLEKLEDAKCVIRSSKSKRDEQCNDQKKKEKDRRTNKVSLLVWLTVVVNLFFLQGIPHN
jgi:hypothetical protein